MSTAASRSISRALADDTLDKLIGRLHLKEVHGAEHGPFMSLKSAMSPAPVGWVRMFQGGGLEKVINVGLEVPMIGMDSHMIFAFTKADSAIPHFTVDSVRAPGMHAFHLDLIPRADLGAHLAYMDATLSGLTETFTEAKKIEGLTPAHLTPRQIAMMSPWMLAFRTTEEAFAKISAPVDAYLQHWFGLLDKGISPEITSQLPGDALALRDRRNRAALFSPEVDPVWVQVDRLVGGETSVKIRELLKMQEELRG